MGNTRRIAKKLNKSICIAKTGVIFQDCPVLLAVSDPVSGQGKAEKFKQYMSLVSHRSSLMNVYDLMGVSLMIQSKLENGEPIFN